MSTNTILKGSAIAAMTFAAMAVSASANAQSSRYGNVYDYERGQNCGQACVAPAPNAHGSSRYGHTVTHSAPITHSAPMPVAPAPVYVDCVTMGTCAPQPTTVYTQPAPVQYHSSTTYAAPTYAQAPANCPAGTTAQPDGTCMQSSYSATTSYTQPSTSYSSSSYSASTSSMPADCPAGTTAQSDGTCLQGSSSYTAPTTSYDSYSSSSYSTTSTAPANCPAGTTAQADGTCMQGGSSAYASSSSSYTGSSVEIYTGDATTSSNTTQSYGYTSDGAYAATDYLPVRK